MIAPAIVPGGTVAGILGTSSFRKRNKRSLDNFGLSKFYILFNFYWSCSVIYFAVLRPNWLLVVFFILA